MTKTRVARLQFMTTHITNLPGLSAAEIGALDSPLLIIGQVANLKYIDFADTDTLATQGRKNPRYELSRLVHVDYAVPDLDYSKLIHERFDLIVANHVVEHIPNLIAWFQELGKLQPRGGKIFLAVPDKRYTFDIIRNNTTFIDLLRNRDRQLRKPDFYQILSHFYFHKDVTAQDTWSQADISEKIGKLRFSAHEAIALATRLSAQDYADVHCNVFTRDSFWENLNILTEINEIPYRITEMSEVAPFANEFCVILTRL